MTLDEFKYHAGLCLDRLALPCWYADPVTAIKIIDHLNHMAKDSGFPHRVQAVNLDGSVVFFMVDETCEYRSFRVVRPTPPGDQ